MQHSLIFTYLNCFVRPRKKYTVLETAIDVRNRVRKKKKKKKQSKSQWNLNLNKTLQIFVLILIFMKNVNWHDFAR